ncbi:MAG: cupin domain-containing protein [Alphaproteobacteria bacterium]
MAAVDKLIERDKDVVCRGINEIALEDILAVEGKTIPGAAEMLRMKALIVTPHVMVLHAARKKGMADPPHQHDDHDTVSVLVSGKMKIHIGGKSFTAEPGAVWRHRPGAKHWSEAIEDSVVIEIKTPPVKTW